MIPFGPWDLLAAWGLDALVGDPPRLARFHPVVWIGRLIALLERPLLRTAAPPSLQIAAGALLWVLTVGTALGVSFALLLLLGRIHPHAQRAGAILLGWSVLATRDLDRQTRGVVRAVGEGDLPEARARLAMIVGRDTAELPPSEIHRAAFETAAENASDGVVAPLLFLVLGAALGLGPVAALGYKAVNTLDSMVGYRNSKYLYFGRISARLDDVFNWLPARWTALAALAAGAALFGGGLRGWRVLARDARKHASPNSGYPEAAFAGALGVRIGGTNFYGGAPRVSPSIGDPVHPLDGAAVRGALLLLWVVSGATLLLGAGLLYKLGG